MTMRFRASNLFLLAGIVLAIALAILFTSRAQQAGSDLSSKDLDENAKVLDAFLGQVLGLGYIYTGDSDSLQTYEKGAIQVERQIAALRNTIAGSGSAKAEAADAEVAAIRAFQRSSRMQIDARRRDPLATQSREDGLELGADINGVMATNRQLGVAVEEARLDAQSRTNSVSVGAVAVLGLLIMALGLTARREDRRRWAHRRFSEGLQAARTESEAYLLLRSHLQRIVRRSEVAVFNRNNSADRLEPSTPLADDSELAVRLRGAKPDDCLAVRTAKATEGGEQSEDFLRCDVCGELPGGSICVPSVVSGEVIGSVLVRGRRPPGEAARRNVADGVVEAAPVVAHLRSLAMAESQAASDALTGLSNKRSGDETLTFMAADAVRSGASLALVLFDLDHFKKVNDTFGHPEGDKVLAAVGAVTSDQTRGGDFSARYGGEEFMALLPGSGHEAGRRVAEKLREEIESLDVPGIDQRITASFGVAAMPSDAGNRDELLRKADRALYAAKRAGRNQVHMAACTDPGPVEPGPIEALVPV